MKQQLVRYIQQEITVTPAELERISSFFYPVSLKRNEWILQEGEVNHHILFVCEGCLRIYFIQEDGVEATRYLAFENQFATALVSFISQSPSLEYIQAVEPSTVLAIHVNDFYQLLKEIPAWEQFYRKYLEKAYVTNTNRLMSFTTMDAGTRYTSLMQQSPAIIQRLPNKLIASYINVSQETLSRIKARHKKKQLPTETASNIKISNRNSEI
jgi:CRP-like cAMP-binding protein